MEPEGLGAVGVEVVSNEDDSSDHHHQQHHPHPHPRSVGHVDLQNQSQRQTAAGPEKLGGDQQTLTSGWGGGAASGPWRTWMIPLDAWMSESVTKRPLM